MKSVYIAICIILLCAPIVVALAISPGRTVINYEPNQILEGSFSLGSIDKDAKLLISVRGPLAPYLKLQETEVNLKPDEWKEIKYTIHLPDVLPAEKLDSQIIAEEVSDRFLEGGTFIAARLTVATQVAIQFTSPVTFVQESQKPPSEGYLEVVNIPIKEVFSGEIADINVELANTGNLSLKAVTAELLVFDVESNEVARLVSGNYSIDPNSKIKARISLDTAKLAPGVYKAKLIVSGGKNIIEREFTFTLTPKPTTQAVARAPRINNILVSIVFIVVLVNVGFWLIYYRRRRKRTT